MKRGTLFKEFLNVLSLGKSLFFPEAEWPHEVNLAISSLEMRRKGDLDIFKRAFVGDGQSFPAFLPAGCQYSPAICCGHAFHEAMLVLPLSSGRLKCSFHDTDSFCLNSQGLQR
jgi:hypothetical protein